MENRLYIYIYVCICIQIIFLLLRILNIFNTYTQREERKFFKETFSDVYPK